MITKEIAQGFLAQLEDEKLDLEIQIQGLVNKERELEGFISYMKKYFEIEEAKSESPDEQEEKEEVSDCEEIFEKEDAARPFLEENTYRIVPHDLEEEVEEKESIFEDVNSDLKSVVLEYLTKIGPDTSGRIAERLLEEGRKTKCAYFPRAVSSALCDLKKERKVKKVNGLWSIGQKKLSLFPKKDKIDIEGKTLIQLIVEYLGFYGSGTAKEMAVWMKEKGVETRAKDFAGVVHNAISGAHNRGAIEHLSSGVWTLPEEEF